MKKLKVFIVSLLLVVATLSFGIAMAIADTSETIYKLIDSEFVIENYTYAVKVRGPDGKLVSIKDGSFVLTNEGEYEIVYPDKTVTVKAIKQAFDVQIQIDSSLEDSYSAGSVITVPGATVTSDMQSFDGYSVKISKNSEVLKTLDCEINEEKQFFVNESGNYALVYTVVDMVGITHTKTVNFTVKDVKELYFNKLPQSASYGTELNVGFPNGFYKGVNYAVEVKVTNPDGTEEAVKSPYYTLKRLGAYIFTYKSTVDGEVITKNQTVICANQESPFTFIKGSGEVSEQNLPSNVFDTYKTKGVLVKSDDTNVTFFYNKIVNLNNLSDERGQLLEFLPYSFNGEHLSQLRVTLTDVYDPNNKVALYYQSSPYDIAHSHVIAEYKGNTCAVSNDPRDAVYGTILKDLGTTIYNGTIRPDSVEKTRLFDLQYNVAEKQINFYGRLKDYTYSKQIIIDLDDPNHVGLENVFQGFKTGEVIVGFELINNENGGVYVVSVGGENVANSQVDASKLIVMVDEENQVLSGAKNYKFKLPNVQKSVLISDSETLDLTVKKEGKEYTQLVKNGYFYPTETGVYDFIYSTVYQGQTVEKTYKITINENPVPVVISDVTLTNLEYFAYNKLPIVSVSGGTGDLSVETSVYCDDNPVEIVDGEFIYVTSSKPYTVKVVVTDSVGVVAEKTFELKLKEGAGIVLGGELPSSVRKGQSVSLPSYTEYKVVSGTMTEADDVKVYLDGTLITGNEFTVPSDKDSVNIVYKVNDETVKTATVNVLEGITNASSIFSSEISDSIVLESGVAFKYKAAQSGKEVKVANKIAGKNIFFRLSVNNGFASFGEIKVVISDTVEENKSVIVRLSAYTSYDGKIILKVNDDANGISLSGNKYTYGANCGEAGADEKYANSAYTTFEFYVDIANKAIKTTKGSKIVYLDKFANGQKIGKFNGDVANVSFSLDRVSGEADLVIGGISNQQFSYNIQKLEYDDNVGPELMIFGNENSMKVDLNQKYTVARAIGVDVIQASTFTKVTVEAPDGTKIINNKNADIEREITLDQYGTYKITYTSTDSVGNKTTKNISIGVEDSVAPTITLNGNYKTQYSVNDEIKIVSMTTKDNNSVVKEFIHIQNTSGISVVKAGDTVKLSVKGSYRIAYWAEDAFGNVTRHVVAFDVK